MLNDGVQASLVEEIRKDNGCAPSGGEGHEGNDRLTAAQQEPGGVLCFISWGLCVFALCISRTRSFFSPDGMTS